MDPDRGPRAEGLSIIIMWILVPVSWPELLLKFSNFRHFEHIMPPSCQLKAPSPVADKSPMGGSQVQKSLGRSLKGAKKTDKGTCTAT